MLSKNSKTVYKMAKKSKECRVSYDELKTKLNWDDSTIQSACNLLIDMNIADTDYKTYITATGRCQVKCGIVLTEKGRNRLKFMIASESEFFVRSVVVPIIVSIATTLLTMWVTRMLGFY